MCSPRPDAAAAVATAACHGGRRRVAAAAWLIAVLAVVATIGNRPLRAASGSHVTFRAEDGRTIDGLLFEADQRPAAAVVLLPMLGRPKDDWQAVGQRLSDAGVTALAIDLPAQTMPSDPREVSGWTGQVRAAVGFLSSRSEVRPGAIGVAGASLGASIAALASASDPRVRALALISPATEYRGVRIEAAMRQYGGRPALLLASSQDPYAARTARELSGKDAPGPREVRMSDVKAHGTMLLAQDKDLVRGLVEWFQRTLG